MALLPAIAMSASATDEGWGKPSNGLRCRIVSVDAAMSEEEIDLSQEIKNFDSADDVAFAVELENMGEHSISLLDTRYGDSYGDAKRKAKSDWFGQFLFSIVLLDESGAVIEGPSVDVIGRHMTLSGTLVATLEPGCTHRFLLRPMKWLSVMTQRLEQGKFQAIVHYHGLPTSTANRIREYRPDATVLGAWSGDAASQPAAFDIAKPTNASPKLSWGEASNGLRAAVELVPNESAYSYGAKIQLKLHLQNVSEKPIMLATQLWLSDLPLSVKNENGNDLEIVSTTYSGWTLSGRIKLQPQQTTILDAGNVGIAAIKALPSAFGHVTNRVVIAPVGTFRMQLSHAFFGGGFSVQDGKGKQLAPLDGDWSGKLATGFTQFIVASD